ncbi:hypothetical protein SPFM12_00037 [Salmonella phage SPFM12]|nr:hypothetical protein SPFM12_00037 [Salmonella phage SPFM12]
MKLTGGYLYVKRWFFDRFLPVFMTYLVGVRKKAIASMVPDAIGTPKEDRLFEKNVIKDIDVKTASYKGDLRWKTYGFTTIDNATRTLITEIQVDWNAVLDQKDMNAMESDERNKNLAKVEGWEDGTEQVLEGIKSAGVDEAINKLGQLDSAIKFRMDDKKARKYGMAPAVTPKEFLSGEEVMEVQNEVELTDPRKVNQGFFSKAWDVVTYMQTLFNKMKMTKDAKAFSSSMPNSIQLADVGDAKKVSKEEAFMLQRFIPIYLRWITALK